MKYLTFYEVDSIDELARPDEQELFLDTPALEVFTDLTVAKAPVIESDYNAIDAIQLMQKEHLEMMFVVDEEEHFLGLIREEDLNQQSIIIRQSKGYQRDELSISDFMIERSALKSFDYNEIIDASIRDILYALRKSDLKICLVIDRNEHKIRGIITVKDIAKKLKIPLSISIKSNFDDIYRAING